ncbi:hypothetical protein VZO05_13370 [Aggregatilineales bacterium SYSU G02658]
MSGIDLDRVRRLLRSPIESDRRRALTMIEQSNDLNALSAVLGDVLEAMKRETDRDIKRQGQALLNARRGELAEALWEQFSQDPASLQNLFAPPTPPVREGGFSASSVVKLLFGLMLSLAVGASLVLYFMAYQS